MGLLARLREQRSSLANPDSRLMSLFGGTESTAGVQVTPLTSLTLAAWWACVQVISEDVAGLPLIVYRRLRPKGRERATDHPLYSLLHDQPNPEMTAFSFWQALVAHVCCWGNGYAEIEFDRAGRVKALWPLRPDNVVPERRSDGSLVYNCYIPERPGVKQQYRVFELPPERVLHLVGLSFDGLRGYSPVAMARESIGLALAAEKFGAALFRNNARPGGFIRHPGKLSEEAQERILKSFERRAGGLDQAHRLAILEEGMEFQAVGMPPEDVEFLTTRQHQVEEICRWHRVQPHKIQHLLRATFSNIEHQSHEHWSDTIRPYCIRIAQEVMRKCLTPAERQVYFVEHLPDAILWTDIKSRYEAYAIARQWGWMSANDICERENLNPVPGGDTYLSPLNMSAMTRSAAPVEGRFIELRALPSGATGDNRRRLARAYEPLLEDAIARIVRREKRDVLEAALRCFQQRDRVDFDAWARDYYAALQADEQLASRLWTAYFGLAEAASADAAAEVGLALGEMTPELKDFLRAYIKRYMERHCGMSMADIMEALGKPGEDPLELLQMKLDGWDSRPAREAAWESRRVTHAIARETWRAQGVTHLRWVTHGDTCPYCRQLHGRVVGIDAPFARKGEHFNDPDNPNNWLSCSTDFHHPPIHEGCDCSVVPE